MVWLHLSGDAKVRYSGDNFTSYELCWTNDTWNVHGRDPVPVNVMVKTIPQAQDTLNMLRTLRVHPKFSAYRVLEGVNDSNRVPFVQPGTRVTIFDPPGTRASRGPPYTDVWYISLAYDHYQCWEFAVQSTGVSVRWAKQCSIQCIVIHPRSL